MHRLVLMLSFQSGLSAAEIRSAHALVRTALREICDAAGLGLGLGSPVQDMGFDVTIRPVDLLVEIDAEREADLIEAATAAGAAIKAASDPAISLAMLGRRRVQLTAAERTMALAVAWRRRADLTAAQFHEYWETRHGPLVMSMMPPEVAARLTYEQIHVDRAPSKMVSRILGFAENDFDGVLEVGAAATADIMATAADPALLARARTDEQAFADTSRLRGGLFDLERA